MAIENFYCNEITEKKEWADCLGSLPTSSTYTSWAWGEYKQRAGWAVNRISIWDKEKSNLLACFQLQKQVKFKFITILLIQGGIHLKNLSDNHYHEVLEFVMKEYVHDKKNVVIVINHQSGSSQNTELGLLRGGFSPVLNSTSYTYLLDSTNDAIGGKSLSKNWSHNLKRAVNNKQLSAEWITDPKERKRAFNDLEGFYAGLLSRKGFSTAINFDNARDIIIDDMDFKMIEARLDDKVIALRVGYYCNDHALDFLAASGEAAKNTYANYLLLRKLVEQANEDGKKYFDCGGINPAGNMGVYNFKKGLGGRLAINGPIWINASGPWMKKLGRFLFSLGS